MPEGAASFNHPGIEQWNVGNVLDMQAMFAYAESMDLVLSSWAVSRVMNLDSMFDGCASFTGSGLETWITSSATSMNFMFRYVTGDSVG
jgi:hypothetical protein